MSTIDEVKAEQGRRLAQTDWFIVRALDPTDGRAVPRHVMQLRQRIRNAAHALEKLGDIPDDVPAAFDGLIGKPPRARKGRTK